MSDKVNYCTLKGFGWAFLIVAFLMVVAPALTMVAIMGENYKYYCKTAIHLPCIGVSDE